MKCAFLRRFIYVPILLSLFGCVSQEAQLNDISLTPMNFEVSAPVTMAKIMVWGSSASGDAFAKVVDPTQVDTYEWYRNGDWKVYALGWTGTDLSGTVYCSRVERKFEGPKETYKIDLTLADCNHADFAGTLAGMADLGPTKLELCESVSGITSGSQKCTDNFEDASRKQARGHAMSYRVSLRSFIKKGKKTTFNSGVLTSSCQLAMPTSLNADSGLAQGTLSNLPLGDGSTTPFYMQVEAFPGSSTCDSSSHGSHTVTLPNGYRSQGSKTFYDVDGGTHKLFLQMSSDEICKGAALSQTFAGGVDASAFSVGQKDDSNASPRLICNASQFYNILSAQHQSFKLLKDIDLRSYYKGVNTSAYLNGISGLADGSNFFPLGLDTTSLSRVSSFTEPRTDFPYNFDGGGKTITGMRINIPAFYNSACVAFTCYRLGHYRRVRIVDWEMRGGNSVSTLGGSHGGIYQVEVIRPRVEGADYVGGLANSAKLVSGDVKNIRVSEARVKCSSFCGGAIGFTDYVGGARTVIMENISVDGVVDCSGDKVGGILGNENFTANFSVTLARARFEGIVKGARFVGGLIGDYSNLLLSSTYASAYVSSNVVGSSIKQGGLLGGSTFVGASSLSVDQSYFFGSLVQSCDTFDTTCLIGNLVGQPTGGASVTNSYHQNQITGLTATDTGTTAAPADFYGIVNPGADFEIRTADIPRFKYESGTEVPPFVNFKSNCGAAQDISDQIIAGKGTSAQNPVMVCNGKQLAAMTTYSNRHFKVGSPIYAYTPIGNTLSELTGSIDGGNQPIYSVTLNQTIPSMPLYAETAGMFKAKAWWKTLSGPVSNLYFYAPTISHVANTNAAALLALENSSTIDNVRIENLATDLYPIDSGTSVKGLSALIGYNKGTIKNARVSGTMAVSTQSTGFVYANSTTGVISDSSTTVKLNCELSGFSDCAQILGLVHSQLGTITRTYSGAALTGGPFARGDSTNSFAVLSRNNTGTIEDVQVSGSSSTKYWANAGILNVNQGILKRAYSDADVKMVDSSPPTTLPGTPTQSDWLKLPNGGVGYLDVTGTNEDVLTLHPGRFYPGLLVGVNTYNVGSCASTTSLMGTIWDVLVNPTYYFAAKNESPTQPRYAVTTATQPGGFLKLGTATCWAANPGTITIGYQTPASTWQTEITAPLALSTFSSFDNHVNAQGETVWLADLNDSGDSNRVNLIRRALKSGSTLPETAPTWVFDTTTGIRLWHRYLEE